MVFILNIKFIKLKELNNVYKIEIIEVKKDILMDYSFKF